mgnify:FL=1
MSKPEDPLDESMTANLERFPLPGTLLFRQSQSAMSSEQTCLYFRAEISANHYSPGSCHNERRSRTVNNTIAGLRINASSGVLSWNLLARAFSYR